MDGFTSFFVPFSSKTVKGGILFPKLPVHPMETCRLCGRGFRPKNRLQAFCSVKCQKYVNNRSEVSRRLRCEWKRKRRRIERLLFQYAVKSLNQTLGRWEKREITGSRGPGTRAPSTSLKIVKVNGQERVYGAVWLERQMQKRRRAVN